METSIELVKSNLKNLLERNQNANSKILTPSPDAPSQRTIKIRAISRRILEHPIFSFILTLFTIWALFSTDIKFAATNKGADMPFQIIISVIFFIFVLENFVSAYAKPEYFVVPNTFKRLPGENFKKSIIRRLNIGSFYFYLDWIATLSLLFEMDWVTGGSLSTDVSDTVSNTSSYANAAARYGRLLRLVRMIRLIRLAKLYKYLFALLDSMVKKRKKHRNLRRRSLKGAYGALPDGQQHNELEDNHEEEDILSSPLDKITASNESQVGEAMSDLTNRRIIILVLVILLVVPQFNGSPSDLATDMCAQFINVPASLAYINTNAALQTKYANAYDFALGQCKKLLPVIAYKNRLSTSPAAVALPGVTTSEYKSSIFSSLRPEEYYVAYSTDTLGTGLYTQVSINTHDQNIENSLLSIYTTLFIAGLLLIGTLVS